MGESNVVLVGKGQLGLDVGVEVSNSPAIDAEPDPGSPAFILQTSDDDLP